MASNRGSTWRNSSQLSLHPKPRSRTRVEVVFLVQVLGRADHGHALAQGVVDGTNAANADEERRTRQHPSRGHKINDADIGCGDLSGPTTGPWLPRRGRVY